ncbi:unnamed protein product [Gadus morhua 'NCC']
MSASLPEPVAASAAGKWQPARPASGSQRGRQVAASAAGKWQPARTVAASAAGLSSQLASRYQPASQPVI